MTGVSRMFWVNRGHLRALDRLSSRCAVTAAV